MGTRFLASEECPIANSYKEKIIKAKDVDTSVIFRSIGRTSRVIKNKYSSKYLSMETDKVGNEELVSFSKGSLRAAVEGDVLGGALMAGECSGLIKSVMPAKHIIQKLINESILSRKVPSTDPIIGNYLNHIPPILLVDEVIDVKAGKSCMVKSTFEDERWFFKCHYPGNPIMPGSLLMELMSQVITIAVSAENNDESQNVQTVISNVEKIKFHKPVFPGTELITYAEIESAKRSIIKGTVWCKSNDELICSSSMVLVLTSF